MCELNLKTTFARLDQGTVSEDFLGDVSTRLLAGIKPDLHNKAGKLHDIALALIEPYEMLISKQMRKKIIDALPLIEAKTLAARLNIHAVNSTDVYKLINKTPIKKNTHNETVLLEFFDVEKPISDVEIVRNNSEKILPIRGLFDYQRTVVDKSMLYLNTNPHRVLMHMPTGSGKTRIAMRIISNHLLQNEPTVVVWLAYSDELCEQAIDEFSKMWKYAGNRELDIYRFFGKYRIDLKNMPSDGLVVGGLNKLYNTDTGVNSNLFLSRLADKTTLVIMDEAHQSIAKTYNYILKQLTEKHDKQRLLGLTATPGRTWNKPNADKELARFFSGQKITLNKDNPIKFLIKEGYLAETKIEPLVSDVTFTEKELYDISSKEDVPQYINEKLALNESRSLMILAATQKLIYEGHKRIIIFGSTVGHARALAAALIVKRIKSMCVASDTTQIVRQKYINKYKQAGEEPIVMCNYGVLTTGFDAPCTSAAIIARPTKSLVLYSQMAGRAMRGPKSGGNKTAKIITVADIKLPGFDDFGKAFLNWEDIW